MGKLICSPFSLQLLGSSFVKLEGFNFLLITDLELSSRSLRSSRNKS